MGNRYMSILLTSYNISDLLGTCTLEGVNVYVTTHTHTRMHTCLYVIEKCHYVYHWRGAEGDTESRHGALILQRACCLTLNLVYTNSPRENKVIKPLNEPCTVGHGGWLVTTNVTEGQPSFVVFRAHDTLRTWSLPLQTLRTRTSIENRPGPDDTGSAET